MSDFLNEEMMKNVNTVNPAGETAVVELGSEDLLKIAGGLNTLEKVGVGVFGGTGIGLLAKGVHYLCTRPAGGASRTVGGDNGGQMESSGSTQKVGPGDLDSDVTQKLGNSDSNGSSLFSKLGDYVLDGVEDGIIEDIPA